jgi:hypothetical protein
MLEETRQWDSGVGGVGEDVTTPSESSELYVNSGDGSRLDPSVLFFSKSDLIMVGESFTFGINTDGPDDTFYSG